MRELVLGLLFLTATLLVVDLLAWQGLRRAVRLRPGSRCRRGLAGLFWGTAALVPPLLAFGLLLARGGDDTAAWRIVSTVGVLYVPKFVLAAAVLVDWLVAGLGRLAVRFAVADPGRRAAAAARAAGVRTFSLLGVGLGAAMYVWILTGAMAGREALTVRRVDVPVPGLPAQFDGLVIAHVSDLHLSSLRSRPKLVDRLIAAVDEARPDLVACTGDLAPVEKLDEGPEILGRLQSRLGTFAVPGNHDFGTRELAAANWTSPEVRDREVAALREAYARRGARLLVNEAATVERGGARLTLIGTGVFDQHHGYRDSDLDLAVAGVGDDDAAILLTHNPELWDLEVVGRRPIVLTLAGHTHGGQIGLEVGPLRVSLAGMSLRRWAGLYREGDQYLYVNRGVGLYGPPFRAGIPAELALIRLVRAAPPA
jgi:hypothetical protein